MKSSKRMRPYKTGAKKANHQGPPSHPANTPPTIQVSRSALELQQQAMYEIAPHPGDKDSYMFHPSSVLTNSHIQQSLEKDLQGKTNR